MYVQGGRLKEAMTQYKTALKLSKDHITEIEAVSHFKIGRTLLQILNKQIKAEIPVEKDLKQKFFLAKNHLIDFQIQCHDIPEKTMSLQKKMKDARTMLSHINEVIKPQGSNQY